ncbi:MAG: TMEM175 family protein, partial [Candidatus Nanopelagicales bacterium]
TQGFERVILFSDAVFAISLTLIAVQLIGPALTDLSNGADAGTVIAEGLSNVWAYAFTFLWVAFYWKANHRFTLTLGRMDGRYIWAILVYLALIALLPFPAALLGEDWDPRALAFFFVYLAFVSAMETVLIVVGFLDDLYLRPIARQQRKRLVLLSLSPVLGALVAAPLCFVTAYGNYLALAVMAVIAFGASALIRRRYPAT